MAISMAMSGKLWIVMLGALLALAPVAGAAVQKTGKAAKGKPAPAGLVVFADSRGCKLLSSESAVKRMKEIASIGSVTWKGVCRKGFISGSGVLREEGHTVIDGRTRKFAYYLSGTANKGVRTGRWKRETFEKFTDSPKFTAGIATVEFVNGSAVGAPKPIAVTSWSQYTTAFSTRILAPAIKEQSLAASVAETRPVAIAPDSQAATSLEPVASAGNSRPMPAAPAATQQPASLPVPPVTPMAAPAASTASEVPVKLTRQIPAFVESQSFAFGTGCYMDTLDGQLWEGAARTVKDRKSINIRGWAVDEEEKKLPEASYLRLESSTGQRFYAPTIAEDRPDVAKYLGAPAFVKSGYRALVSAENLPAGEYDVMILMNVGGRNVLCGSGRTLKL